MTSTSILTFDQGITLLINSGFFLVFNYIYHMIFSKKMPFTNIMITGLLFSLWLLSVTVFSNIALALNVPLTRTASVPFNDEDTSWKKY